MISIGGRGIDRAYHVCVRFADTLGDHLVIALFVACIPAVLALHACRFEQEFLAECTQDDSVELLLNEFVAVLLEHFLFALAHGTLTSETSLVEGALADIRFDWKRVRHKLHTIWLKTYRS